MDQLSQFISHHWQLVTAFVGMFMILMIYEHHSLKKQGKSITTAQAVEQINHFSAVVIDLRPAEVYKKGHIIGAIRATMDDFSSPKLQAFKDKPLILVCARGIESRALNAKVQAQGFNHVMVLAGGVAAWQAANLPLVKK